MTDGLMFVTCGEKALEQYRYAADALRQSQNHYPVQTIGRDYGAANKQASRHAKTSLYNAAQFDKFLYLDADTRPRESLQPLFDILSDGWDIVMSFSSNQDCDAFWHVDEHERMSTLEEIGLLPLQLQCGIMAVCKNERTRALFEKWHNEWMRYSGEDQAAFIRALYQAPVKVWLMGQPWNGGAAIGHNWGGVAMKVAKFVISEQLIVESLHLPEGTRIIAIQSVNDSPYYNDYEFTIENNRLKDLIEYQPIPTIRPIFYTTVAPCGHVSSIKVETWGQDEG